MVDVIDLRKQKKIVSKNIEEDATSSDKNETHKAPPEVLKWSALEYKEVFYSPRWFITIGAIAVLLIVIGVLAKSYFFVTLIALAFVAIVLYTRRPPRTIEFAITSKGIDAGKTHYEFSRLKSFWLFDAPGVRELSLETTKLLSPYVRIPLGEQDAGAVEQVLVRYLPKKEHEETVSDQIARGFGF